MSIVTQCMVLSLRLSAWGGQRLDKDASVKVTEDANAAADAARVNKHLVPKETLQPIMTINDRIRRHFYAHTAPWGDNGDRIISRLNYPKFRSEHDALVADYAAEAQKLATETYPAARAQAEFRMGTMFKADDYPPAETLAGRFHAKLDILPVASGSDFRVEMSAGEVANIKASIENALIERQQKAMGKVYERVTDTLTQYHQAMASGKVFRDSTIRNLEELVDLLPGLNILDDPQLTQVHAELVEALVGYDAKQLRDKNDPHQTRTYVATESKRILDLMAGFSNAFQVAA